MNLEELLSNTKSKVVYLIDNNGEILDQCYQNEDLLKDTKEKVVAFSSTIYDMCNHFFKNFLDSEFTNICMKSSKENIILVKHDNKILCFFSEKTINQGVLELSLKKMC